MDIHRSHVSKSVKIRVIRVSIKPANLAQLVEHPDPYREGRRFESDSWLIWELGIGNLSGRFSIRRVLNPNSQFLITS